MSEYNLIQNPELISRLSRSLGLRQAHVSPTLLEGVQPVVILEDLSESATASPIRVWSAVEDFLGALGAGQVWGLSVKNRTSADLATIGPDIKTEDIRITEVVGFAFGTPLAIFFGRMRPPAFGTYGSDVPEAWATYHNRICPASQETFVEPQGIFLGRFTPQAWGMFMVPANSAFRMPIDGLIQPGEQFGIGSSTILGEGGAVIRFETFPRQNVG